MAMPVGHCLALKERYPGGGGRRVGAGTMRGQYRLFPVTMRLLGAVEGDRSAEAGETPALPAKKLARLGIKQQTATPR